MQLENGEQKYIVSACLVGLECRYNGKHKENKLIREMLPQAKLIPVCPEQVGGLPTPRPPAEIVDGSGLDVLENRARVVNIKDEDVTDFFIRGAFQAVKLAKTLGCKRAILKERSPSCGVTRIFDGSFNGQIRDSQGVTTALLVKEGIKVVSENDLRKTNLWD